MRRWVLCNDSLTPLDELHVQSVNVISRFLRDQPEILTKFVQNRRVQLALQEVIDTYRRERFFTFNTRRLLFQRDIKGRKM